MDTIRAWVHYWIFRWKTRKMTDQEKSDICKQELQEIKRIAHLILEDEPASKEVYEMLADFDQAVEDISKIA